MASVVAVRKTTWATRYRRGVRDIEGRAWLLRKNQEKTHWNGKFHKRGNVFSSPTELESDMHVDCTIH
jgi:hypothetical protein